MAQRDLLPEEQPQRALARDLPRNELGELLGKNGRPIKPDGRAAKQLLAEHRAAVIARGDAIPMGPALRDNARPLDGAVQGETRRFGAWHQTEFRPVVQPRDVATFARQIAGAAATIRAPATAIITFTDPARGNIGRSVKFNGDISPQRIQREIDALMFGAPKHGSDVVDDGFQLVTASFAIGSVPARAGAGLKFTGISKRAAPPNPWFKLIDTDTKQDGNCLLTVLRTVARLEGTHDERVKASTIRTEYGIPDGPIEARPELIDTLARRFGLRVSVIIGVDAPRDTARVFDDNPAREKNKNRCITVATPIVIAEGGAEDAPQCRLWLEGNHYQYIQEDINLPWATCEVTGDLLTVAVKEMTAKERTAHSHRRVIEQGRNWYGDRLRNGEEKKRTKIKHRKVVVFDYETTYSPAGGLRPYSLGFLEFDPNAAEIADGDFTGDIQYSVRESTSADNPRDVSAALIAMINATPDDTQLTFVSFNGTAFDHFILCAEALNNNMLTGRSPLFATSNGIRGFVLNGRHTALDLARIITGSLKDACKDFCTSPAKLDGFSHAVPQAAADAGKLGEWIAENRLELSEYQRLDVLATASLLVRLRKVTREMTGIDILDDDAPRTAGGIAWKCMTEKCAIPAAVKSEETDKWIRSGITGGRVQVYGEKMVSGVPLRMVDFVSLYPTAMCAYDNVASVFSDEHCFGFYPDATDSEGTAVTRFVPNTVGIYNVTIHRQPTPNVLPRRVEDKPLDWDYKGEFDTVCTHIDIILIREKCGEDAVTVHSGRTWRSRGDLFRPFIDPLIAIKNEQDRLKNEESPSYNSALRAFVKLLMCAASGKCAQRNYDDTWELATGTARQLRAASEMSKDFQVEFWPIAGETCLVVGKKPAGAIYNPKSAKPSVLAVLIYSYSRALVYRTLCQHNIMYSDTDSGLFRLEDYERLCAAFPQLMARGPVKRLGELDQELAKHTTATAFMLAPKDYAIFLHGKDGKLIPGGKQKIKGVNQYRDRLIDAPLADLATCGLDELGAEFSSEERGVAPRFSRPLSDTAVCFEFFELRSKGHAQYTLCSQLERTCKQGFQLTQRFLVKGFNKPKPGALDDGCGLELAEDLSGV